ncbi:hypothetical protein [Gloeocapsopsis dulcis]|uniref:Uncharacterized protein n=1 Tax=Gloeocapsopsis dulcis AAB1 = 1H9 TaxID=1433147 RepID=A0A6N8G367_9CHRO|nr:hypothetical protein [Gloeocapsopsis dulcis]MUL38955.1 hypothetical protein [Gloeocapsopsis dulcis AAB1 = 1H9]WNN89552.1 hypothetical protein P0S91_00120 [Gloeocapsopsis dulcis]
MTTKETKVRLPLELHGWLMSQAESQDISLTKYIIQVLEDHKTIPNSVETIPTDFEKRFATLESRLEKLESDSKSNTWKPEFTLGQRVTRQYSRLYGLLGLSPSIGQKSQDGKVQYYYYPTLGVVTKTIRTKTPNLVFQVLEVFDPLTKEIETWTDEAGNTLFMDCDDNWQLQEVAPPSFGDSFGDTLAYEAPMTEVQLTPVEPNNSGDNSIPNSGDTSDAMSLLVSTDEVLSTTEPNLESVGDNSGDSSGDTDNQTLTTEDLLTRFKSNLKWEGGFNILKTNLPKVGMKKLKAGWTVQYDPDGLTWIPTDEKAREYWIVFQPSPQVPPDLSPVV